MLGELAWAPAANAFGPDVLYAGVLPPSDVPQKYGCLYPKTVCLQHQSDTSLNGTRQSPRHSRHPRWLPQRCGHLHPAQSYQPGHVTFTVVQSAP